MHDKLTSNYIKRGSIFAMFNKFCCFILMLFVSQHTLAIEKVALQLSWENEFQFAGYYALNGKVFTKIKV